MLCLSLVCEFLCANKEKLAVLKRRGVAVVCRTRDQEVAGSSLGRALRRKNSGQVSHTYVPLSPSSITWYRSKSGNTLNEAGKVTVGLAMHWPCVTGLVVYPPTGSKA